MELVLGVIVVLACTKRGRCLLRGGHRWSYPYQTWDWRQRFATNYRQRVLLTMEECLRCRLHRVVRREWD